MPTIAPVRLAIMLGTLVALGPLAIDTYLPALPTMADDFGVAVHRIELSVSVYVLGVALGQWLGGPLSDHFGRKPVAYVGLSVFFVASLAITVCSEVAWLYGLRVLQALGGGATVVIAAASVRDHFNGREAAPCSPVSAWCCYWHRWWRRRWALSCYTLPAGRVFS